MDSTECLNGTIFVGDIIAVAVGDGLYGSGMRIGTVVELTEIFGRWGEPETQVKVSSTKRSGTAFGGLPYTKNFTTPRRMVKLASGEPADRG
jgi:hypothetical protein